MSASGLPDHLNAKVREECRSRFADGVGATPLRLDERSSDLLGTFRG